MSNGTFSGDPKTEWLTEAGDDRRMSLLEDFAYTDPSGKVWDAPREWIVDGASIPRALWSTVGSPYTGDYRRASVVHDVACDRSSGDAIARRAADRMFYHACRAGGCSIGQSTLLYLGVRIGAHLPHVAQWQVALLDASAGPRIARSAADQQLERDFQEAAQIVLQPGEVDDALEIERRTDEALSQVSGVNLRLR